MEITQKREANIKKVITDAGTANKVVDYLKSAKGHLKIFNDKDEVIIDEKTLLDKTINKPATEKQTPKKKSVKKSTKSLKKMGYVEIEEQMQKYAKELKAKRNERLAEIDAEISKLQAEKEKIQNDIKAEQN